MVENYDFRVIFRLFLIASRSPHFFHLGLPVVLHSSLILRHSKAFEHIYICTKAKTTLYKLTGGLQQKKQQHHYYRDTYLKSHWDCSFTLTLSTNKGPFIFCREGGAGGFWIFFGGNCMAPPLENSFYLVAHPLVPALFPWPPPPYLYIYIYKYAFTLSAIDFSLH